MNFSPNIAPQPNRKRITKEIISFHYARDFHRVRPPWRDFRRVRPPWRNLTMTSGAVLHANGHTDFLAGKKTRCIRPGMFPKGDEHNPNPNSRRNSSPLLLTNSMPILGFGTDQKSSISYATAYSNRPSNHSC